MPNNFRHNLKILCQKISFIVFRLKPQSRELQIHSPYPILEYLV